MVKIASQVRVAVHRPATPGLESGVQGRSRSRASRTARHSRCGEDWAASLAFGVHIGLHDEFSTPRTSVGAESLAAGIVAAQPTILAGLIRAEGGGGSGGDTTDDPWETTSGGTTVATTVPAPTGMLCVAPLTEKQEQTLTFDIGVGQVEEIKVVVISETRKRDGSNVVPYASNEPEWTITASVYQGTTLLKSAVVQTRKFIFNYASGVITSEEPSPPPTTLAPGSPLADSFGPSIGMLTNLVTAGGRPFSVTMLSHIGGAVLGGGTLSLIQIIRVGFWQDGQHVGKSQDNTKNLEYDPS